MQATHTDARRRRIKVGRVLVLRNPPARHVVARGSIVRCTPGGTVPAAGRAGSTSNSVRPAARRSAQAVGRTSPSSGAQLPRHMSPST